MRDCAVTATSALAACFGVMGRLTTVQLAEAAAATPLPTQRWLRWWRILVAAVQCVSACATVGMAKVTGAALAAQQPVDGTEHLPLSLSAGGAAAGMQAVGAAAATALGSASDAWVRTAIVDEAAAAGELASSMLRAQTEARRSLSERAAAQPAGEVGVREAAQRQMVRNIVRQQRVLSVAALQMMAGVVRMGEAKEGDGSDPRFQKDIGQLINPTGPLSQCAATPRPHPC